MRAILIDPEKRTIDQIQIDLGGEDSLDRIYAAIGCGRFTTGSRPLRGSMDEGFDTLLVSDDDYEEADPGHHWFQVDADRNPPSSYPLAGRGLVVGVDRKGASCDAQISVAELQARITFTQRKFRGVGPLQRVPGGYALDFKAPIIDGVAEGCAPPRPESWNAKMALSGEPLITNDQFERLLANAPASLEQMENYDPVPVVKIFLPHIRWILVWIYPDDHDRAYAVVQRGSNKPEAGDVLLSEVVNARLGMIAPERDKYIALDQPWSYYLRNGAAW